MDLKKKQAFNAKMGKLKYPRHLNLANGGIVKHFDDGGLALAGPSGGGVNQNTQGPQGFTGAISNALGTNINANPVAAATQAGTNAGQLNAAYTGVNNGINAQVGLANTLAPQAAQGVNSQNTLANQYLQQTMGQGPGQVAQAQLAQSTGQNVANQAALMAGQRGAGANVGLLARDAAQQGAATQQQAAGQGATLEAQQQLAAQQNLANLAQNQIGQAQSGAGAATAAQQAEQNTLQGANSAYNSNLVNQQSNINNVNAANAAANQQQNQGILGGITGALSNIPGVGGLFKSIGSAFADGGEVPAGQAAKNPSFMAKGGSVYHPKYFHEYFAGGGMSGRSVDAVVSPKEVYLNPKQVKEVVERGADPMKIGHHFPGKDKVGRDSLKNDVIKTKLEEGGVVLPIHITTHKDASHRGRKFVEKTVAKHMKRPGGA